jgi:thiamine kinase-like enzyme
LGKKEETFKNYLLERGWVEEVRELKFLAAGEYNENYLVDTGRERFVFRVNHGSQLELDDQIEYEFRALKTVEGSGVTPVAHYCEAKPKGLEGGVLLMEYIEGSPFDYHRDWPRAAEVFSRIHAIDVPESNPLIVQENPVRDIAEESYGLLTRQAHHPLKKEQTRLMEYHQEVLDLAERTSRLFQNEAMCIVNTEVNSGNFIVHGESAHLVDWEKAVVSYRYQDLGHFLVPTTTLWKTEVTYTEEEKLRFLDDYMRRLALSIDLEEIREKTKLLERTILLRGLSWCFMAYFEYTQTDRTIQNDYTFGKIKDFLSNIEWFLS